MDPETDLDIGDVGDCVESESGRVDVPTTGDLTGDDNWLKDASPMDMSGSDFTGEVNEGDPGDVNGG